MKSYFIEKKTVEGKAWTKVLAHILTCLQWTCRKYTETVRLVLKLKTLISLCKVNPTCAAQSLVVADLINGQEYLFRIRAENRFGFGPFAETMERTKARDPIRTFLIFDHLLACCFMFMFYISNKNSGLLPQ